MEQTHSTSIVTKRLKDTLKCDRSEVLYEQVIERNFQIIGDLLKKLDKVFTKHEEYEFEKINYNKRLIKIEADIQAIHNEYRRDNLQIGSKMDDLKLELNGIDKQLRIIYDGNRKGIFKSFKIIDNLELHSQKCVSNCEDLFSRVEKQSKIIKNGRNQEATHLKQKIDPKYISRQKSIISKISENSNFQDESIFLSKGEEEKLLNLIKNEDHRKVQRNIKKCKYSLRKSIQNKSDIKKRNSYSLNQNKHLKFIKEKGLFQKQEVKAMKKVREWGRVSVNSSLKEQTANVNNKPQVCEEQMIKRTEDKMIQVSDLNQKANLVEKTQKRKKYSYENETSFVDLMIIQQKIKQVLKKNGDNSSRIQELGFKIEQISRKLQAPVNVEFIMEQIFALKKQIRRLRQIEGKNCVTKKELEQLVFEKKSKVNEQNIQYISQERHASPILTKCLSCNKKTENNQSSLQVRFLARPEEGRQKKLSLKELKKRTKEILRGEEGKSRIC